jgi:hypothetical protein
MKPLKMQNIIQIIRIFAQTMFASKKRKNFLKRYTQPLIRSLGSEAINKKVYLEKFLTKIVFPCVHQHHGDFNNLFWYVFGECAQVQIKSGSDGCCEVFISIISIVSSYHFAFLFLQ